MENLHFPGDAHPADLETTLEETSPLKTGFSHPTREEIRKIQKKKKIQIVVQLWLKIVGTRNSVLKRILESRPGSTEQSSRTE